MDPEFVPLDPAAWPRAEQFYYFSKIAPTGYSLTVQLDVTKLLDTVRAADLKFFPAYLWLVTKDLNAQTEFKIAEKDGRLGYYRTLTPLYATFHADDKTFSLMWTPFDKDFKTFHRTYLRNQEQFGRNRGILSQKGMLPPENAYTVSCVPWIPFQSFAVHSYEDKPYYFPSVEAGRFTETDGRTLMPLSLTCHHATTDGWHVSRFLEALQSDMDAFGQYL